MLHDVCVVVVMAVALAIHFATATYAPARIYDTVNICFYNKLALTIVVAVDFIEFTAIFTIDFTCLFAFAVVVFRLMQLLDCNTL